MWDLAVREQDYPGIDSMLARYRGAPPLNMRLVPALGRSDTAEVRDLLAEARQLESRQLQIAARYAAAYLEDLALADSLARLDLGWRQRPANRAQAQMLLAWLAVAGGRWAAASSEFAAAEAMDEAGPVFIHRAFGATVPLVPVPTADLMRIRGEIERWQPEPARVGTGMEAALEPHLRLYLLGLLSSRLGDPSAGERAAAAIERLPAPPGGEGITQGLAATVRADLAWSQGRPEAALGVLDRSDPAVPLELVALPRPVHLRQYGLEHARFLRAVASSALRRDPEALRWFRYGLRGSPQEFLYHAPVHLHLGELFERLSQPDSAVAHYGRFVALWRTADSAGVQLVEQVRSRVVRLGGRRPP